MVIGFIELEIYLPYCHSLKEKRKFLASFRDRFKKNNVAFAELDFLDKWQRSKIGLVTLNSSKAVVEKMLQKILLEIEENIEGEVLRSKIEFF